MRLDYGQIEVVDDKMVEVLRCKTPAERIAVGFRMWISVRNMLLCHLRHTHPEWSEMDLQQEVARRLSHGAV